MNWRMEKTRALWQRRSVKAAAIVAVAAAGGTALLRRDRADRVDQDRMHLSRVERGDLVVSILQTGELQARTSRDILNEAYRDAKIVDIVDDGAAVTNGQLLFELESSELMERYLNQQSSVANAEADLMHSQEELEIGRLKYETDLEGSRLRVELAKLDLQKYTEAEYPQMVLRAQSDITLAEQELRKARSELEGTKELFDKGYSNRQELESSQLGVDRKEIEVRNKTNDLDILRNYTYVKRLKELRNDVTNAESALERLQKSYASDVLRKQAALESKRIRLEIERNQLATRAAQYANTKVYADFNGQVFYPKEQRGAKIEKGATVNFRQKILSFPDLSAWNLDVGIPEAMIDRVSLGQEAVATLDAVPGLLLHGRVERISAVPDSQNWFSAGVKTYTITIGVANRPQSQLKPGMTATVEIVTDRLQDVRYVPIQAVVSSGGKRFVYVVERGRKTMREVATGKYDTQHIEVSAGLEEGEELLLYAEAEPETGSRLRRSPLAEERAAEGGGGQP